MRSTTPKYKQIIASGDTRDYLITVNMTLADNTQLTLNESDIWAGSFKIETASSGTSSFDIGSAIIGKCSFQINNYDERFTIYDFFNATATVWLKLKGDTQYYRMGFFTVDEPTFAGALISIEMLDNMWKFDQPIPSGLPTDARGVVNAICARCGMILATQNFHGYQLTVRVPEDMEMNCRELLQYVAMMGCNFCVINDSGMLEFRWYEVSAMHTANLDGGTFDTNTTPYSDGDNADGGNFTDYSSGDDYDGGLFTDTSVVWFTRNYSTQLGTDEITITGVKITVGETVHRIGSEGYVLELENPLVTDENVNTVLNAIWDVLEGFKLRTFDVQTLPDLSVQVGDACAITDIKGNIVYSYVTMNNFSVSNHTVQCNAVTPTRSLSTRYSKTVQTAVEEARKNTDKQISNYDLAVQMINSLAINAMGGFMEFEDLPTGGRIWYISNMPITKNEQGQCEFESNSIVFKMAGNGFFVSINGGQTFVNGYDPLTGQLVVNVLNAIGINAEWIHTGELTVGGTGSGTSNPYITVKDTSNNTICTINSNGIIMYKGLIQSPDYQEETPVGTYSRSGMAINVNNSTIKSPYFALNSLGAFLKGTIEATGGHIGAAVITQDAITIEGDVMVLSGLKTGTYQFIPYDYKVVNDFKLLLKRAEGNTGEGYFGVLDGEHEIYYPITNNQPEAETQYYIDHTIGSPTNPGYVTFEITRFPDASELSVDVYIKGGILAYMGTRGFEGFFDGTFKGNIDSKSGRIAGSSYYGSAFRDDISIVNENGYNNHQSSILIDKGDGTRKPTISRSYYDNNEWKSESLSWGDADTYQTKIEQSITAPSGSGQNGDLQFFGADGSSFKELYRFEGAVEGGSAGSWVKVNLNITTSDTDSINPGVTALATGSLFLVYE